MEKIQEIGTAEKAWIEYAQAIDRNNDNIIKEIDLYGKLVAEYQFTSESTNQVYPYSLDIGDVIVLKFSTDSQDLLIAETRDSNNEVIEEFCNSTSKQQTVVFTLTKTAHRINVWSKNKTQQFTLMLLKKDSIANQLNQEIQRSTQSYESVEDTILQMNRDLYGKTSIIEGVSTWSPGYIQTNITTPVNSDPTALTGYYCLELPCVSGDAFHVSITGGSNGRGWNFLDKNRIVLSQASAGGVIDADIVAPEGTASVLFNTTNVNSILKEINYPVWDKSKLLSGKKIAYIGDSSIDVGNKEWVKWCSEMLGAEYQVFANGGYTYANQFADEDKNTYYNCVKLLVDNLISYSSLNAWIPDVIVLQCGGNDIYRITDDPSNLGSLESAFSDFNYKSLSQDITYYGGLRYNLQTLLDAFPHTTIIVGTVFQRRANDASVVSIPIREVCAYLSLPIIDGNKYSGISFKQELISPVYSDNPDGSNTGSRDYPQYNWIEPTNDVVLVENKTENAVKKYGKYTYDGIHKTLKGDAHIAGFMASQIVKYVGYLYSE